MWVGAEIGTVEGRRKERTCRLRNATGRTTYQGLPRQRVPYAVLYILDILHSATRHEE